MFLNCRQYVVGFLFQSVIRFQRQLYQFNRKLPWLDAEIDKFIQDVFEPVNRFLNWEIEANRERLKNLKLKSSISLKLSEFIVLLHLFQHLGKDTQSKKAYFLIFTDNLLI
jgi:hypothetical protein